MKTLAVERDKAELLRRLRTVRPDSPRRWGRMSAHQMVCHLADAFRMVSGEKPVRCDAGILERTALKWAALYMPFPWPPGIPTTPEIDQEQRGTPPADFAADVGALESLIERFTSPTRSLEPKPHPLFGPMSDAAWLRWGYLHMDHHLRQFGA